MVIFFCSEIINLTQPIYVCREDPNSRHTTIQAIKDRANSTEDWPPLMIFPEGTCTNRQALISFKLGAFYPGVPIQPIIIRYPNRYDSFTWTWAGPGPLQLLWLTLTKCFSKVEVEYLPVYVPNDEEKQNPKLYAKNVQLVMSKWVGKGGGGTEAMDNCWLTSCVSLFLGHWTWPSASTRTTTARRWPVPRTCVCRGTCQPQKSRSCDS